MHGDAVRPVFFGMAVVEPELVPAPEITSRAGVADDRLVDVSGQPPARFEGQTDEAGGTAPAACRSGVRPERVKALTIDGIDRDPSVARLRRQRLDV